MLASSNGMYFTLSTGCALWSFVTNSPSFCISSPEDGFHLPPMGAPILISTSSKSLTSSTKVRALNALTQVQQQLQKEEAEATAHLGIRVSP